MQLNLTGKDALPIFSRAGEASVRVRLRVQSYLAGARGSSDKRRQNAGDVKCRARIYGADDERFTKADIGAAHGAKEKKTATKERDIPTLWE